MERAYSLCKNMQSKCRVCVDPAVCFCSPTQHTSLSCLFLVFDSHAKCACLMMVNHDDAMLQVESNNEQRPSVSNGITSDDGDSDAADTQDHLYSSWAEKPF